MVCRRWCERKKENGWQRERARERERERKSEEGETALSLSIPQSTYNSEKDHEKY